MSEFWDKRAKQFLVISGIVLLLFTSIKLVKYFFDILAIIGISVLIAYLLIGPVDFVTRIIRARTIAVVIVYLLLLSFIVSVFVLLGPKVVKEFAEFTQQIPEKIDIINKELFNLQAYLNNINIPINIPQAKVELLDKLSNQVLNSFSNILGFASSTLHIMFYILVTTVISYYFLLDSHKIIQGLTTYIPDRYHNHIQNLVVELDKCLRGFYGGMVKLAAINATVMFATYMIMGVPYALLLALWHFLSCIIPVVGGWFGLIPAVLVIAFTDPFKIWIPLVVYEGFTRLIKDNFITPRIMGDAIGMHPVLVLIAILVGLKAAGLVGVLFALPLFGVINVTMKYFLQQFSEEKA